LLGYFHKLFENLGKSNLYKKGQYKLVTLDEIVDLRCLPTAYSTCTPPATDACDYCHQKLDDGEVLVCGHGYHLECYQIMEYSCHHCEEYYKRGVYSNVNSFLNRLEKGPAVLTSEEQADIEENLAEDNETAEEVNLNKIQSTHVAFLNAINQVGTW